MQHRDFRRVWTVATSQQFGYWFASVAFQWMVAERTDNDALILGLLYFMMLIPILLFSLPAGIVADRIDRRVVVAIVQSIAIVIGAVTAGLVFFTTPPIWVIMACGFAVGTAHSLMSPAAIALVANSVPSSDLGSAIPLQAIGMNLARILGPALAGVVIIGIDLPASFLVYGAFAVLGLLALRGVPRLSDPAHRVQGLNVLAQARSGLSHAKARPPAGLALAIVAVTSLFASTYLAQLPVVAANSSDLDGGFLLLTSAGGIGALIGVVTLAIRSSGRPSVTSAAVMLLLMGALITTLGWGHNLLLEMALIAAAAGLQFGIMTTCNRVIQQVVQDTHRGRVMSLYQMFWGGLLPIGGLWLGFLITTIGIGLAFTLNGVVVVAFAAWILRPGVIRSAPH